MQQIYHAQFGNGCTVPLSSTINNNFKSEALDISKLKAKIIMLENKLTKFMDIYMSQPSLLTKEDIKEFFINLIYNNPYIKASKNKPEVAIEEMNQNWGGYYDDEKNKIGLNIKIIDNIYSYTCQNLRCDSLLLQTIYVMGHEYTHFLQHQLQFDYSQQEILNTHTFTGLEEDEDGEIKWDDLSWDMVARVTEPHLNRWKREKAYITYFNYPHEFDARCGGAIFTDYVMNCIANFYETIGNKELASRIKIATQDSTFKSIENEKQTSINYNYYLEDIKRDTFPKLNVEKMSKIGTVLSHISNAQQNSVNIDKLSNELLLLISNNEVQKVYQQINAIKHEIEKAQEKFDYYTKHTNSWNEDIKNAKKSLNNYKKEIEIIKNEKVDLSSDYKRYNEYIESYTRYIITEEIYYSNGETNLKFFQNKVNNINQILETKQNELAKLKKTFGYRHGWTSAKTSAKLIENEINDYQDQLKFNLKCINDEEEYLTLKQNNIKEYKNKIKKFEEKIQALPQEAEQQEQRKLKRIKYYEDNLASCESRMSYFKKRAEDDKSLKTKYKKEPNKLSKELENKQEEFKNLLKNSKGDYNDFAKYLEQTTQLYNSLLYFFCSVNDQNKTSQKLLQQMIKDGNNSSNLVLKYITTIQKQDYTSVMEEIDIVGLLTGEEATLGSFMNIPYWRQILTSQMRDNITQSLLEQGKYDYLSYVMPHKTKDIKNKKILPTLKVNALGYIQQIDKQDKNIIERDYSNLLILLKDFEGDKETKSILFELESRKPQFKELTALLPPEKDKEDYYKVYGKKAGEYYYKVFLNYKPSQQETATNILQLKSLLLKDFDFPKEAELNKLLKEIEEVKHILSDEQE